MTKFVNPYGFVKLEGPIQRYEKSDTGEKRYTGYMDCTLNTLTALIIPGTDGKTFFSYDGETPVIPGSSLKGMFRSYHEAIYNGCFSGLDGQNIITKRNTPKTAGNMIPCVFRRDEKGAWHMFSAKRHATKLYDNTGLKGSVKVQLKRPNDIKGTSTDLVKTVKDEGSAIDYDFQKLEAYYLHISEPFKTKKYESLIEEEKEVDTSFLEMSLEDYFERYEQYLKNKTKTIKSLVDQKGSDKILLNQLKIYEDYLYKFDKLGIVIGYYLKCDNQKKWRLYLGHSKIGQVLMNHSLTDLVGEYKPCRETNLCPTCHLFGIISETGANNTASRISFSDAICSNGNLLQPDSTLKGKFETQLMQPRISATEFYFKKPPESAITFATTDYYVSKGNTEFQSAVPNGRKFYWHHGKHQSFENSDEVEVEALKMGHVFDFKVFFESLTLNEIRQLKSTLDLGNHNNLIDDEMSSEPCLIHRIGRGKPLGFGSVKVVVTEVRVKQLNSDQNQMMYNKLNVNSDQLDVEKFNIWNWNAFRNRKDIEITYPHIRGEIFSYFNLNRKNGIQQWLSETNVLDVAALNNITKNTSSGSNNRKQSTPHYRKY